MSKVSSYLQSHISGEVLTRSDVRDTYTRDGSVLQETPDMVIHPRTINDVRKILRFSSQLAAKGHTLSVLARGAGTSTSASAITSGIVLDTSSYLSNVLEYDIKQRLVRVQAGASSDGLISALRLHATTIASLEAAMPATIGGFISEGHGAKLENNYQNVQKAVSRLEVVLSGGEVIQTGPIGKRELSKKKGLPGAEGDVYRGVDAVLEDYSDVIDEIKKEPYRDMSGYPGIADVVSKNGTFDLTPLFVGAQGTLGVISEAIMKAEFRPANIAYGVVAFHDGDTARDALDILRKLSPSFLELMDAAVIESARSQRVEFDWYDGASEKLQKITHVVVYGWQAFGDRAAEKNLKKSEKSLQKLNAFLYMPTDDEEIEKLDVLRDVASYLRRSTTNITDAAPDTIGGFYIPRVNFESFSNELVALGTSLHLDLPLYGSALSNIYTVMPQLSLKRVGDKQKIFKLIDKLMQLVAKHGGIYYAHGGEGKLTTHFAQKAWDGKRRDMVAAIKAVFDPHDILNTGAKQSQEIADLISMIRPDNTIAPHLAKNPGA